MSNKSNRENSESYPNDKWLSACFIFSMVGIIFLTGGIDLATENNAFFDMDTIDYCYYNDNTEIMSCNDGDCKGLKRKYHYSTRDGTCKDGELYDIDSICDCYIDDLTPTAPDNGYPNAQKCWITSCEGDNDWTFTDPETEIYGWLLIGGAILFFITGMVFFWNWRRLKNSEKCYKNVNVIV